MNFFLSLVLTSLVGAIDLNLMTHNVVHLAMQNDTVGMVNSTTSYGPSPASPPTPVLAPDIEKEYEEEFPKGVTDEVDEFKQNEIDVIDDESNVAVDDAPPDHLPEEGPLDDDTPAITIPPPPHDFAPYLDEQESRIERQFHEGLQFAKQHYSAIGLGAVRVHVTGLRIVKELEDHYHDVALKHYRAQSDLEGVTGMNDSEWQQVRSEVHELDTKANEYKHQSQSAKHQFETALIRSDAQRRLAYDVGVGLFTEFQRERIGYYKNQCRELLDTIKYRKEAVADDVLRDIHPFYEVCDDCINLNPDSCTEASIFGCPSGWTKLGKNKCYKGFRETYDWRTARAFCWSNGADLVVLEDATENEAVLLAGKRAGFRNAGRFWIGASTVDSDTHFEWVNGELVDYTSAPLGDAGENLCVESFAPRINEKPEIRAKEGLWNVLDCSTNELGYMCEK